MIYADGMHGRFRLGYGAQFIHVAAATAEERAEIDDLVAGGADPNARDAGKPTQTHTLRRSSLRVSAVSTAEQKCTAAAA